MALLLAALSFRAAAAEAQPGCREAFGDSLAVRTIRAFDRAAAVPPVWDDFTPARHPILLLADSTHRGRPETPVCAAIWRAGAPLEVVELAARPRLLTPLFGMVNLESVGPASADPSGGIPAVPDPVAAELRARGVTRAVVLDVPLDLGRLGRLGQMLREGRVDPAQMQADFAVHEGFHLHVQFPHWLDQRRTYAWPAWDQQPDRRELRERCYAGSPELAAALAREIAALVAAFDAVAADSTRRDVTLGVRHARHAVQLRAERRRLQDTLTVALGGRRISCELAEDLLELEEGTTQWIGHATMVRAGFATMEGLRGRYAGTQPEVFYQTGPLQLWVLEGILGGAAMRHVTVTLARSAGPHAGVFAHFDHHTRLLAERGR
ncbi:MAG TPA: hypothetical protein VFR37_25585 [Longimicrobium sp.]|nr:hypothetical protein [Longimicrobium sp.]